jgi:hypothetical protein
MNPTDPNQPQNPDMNPMGAGMPPATDPMATPTVDPMAPVAGMPQTPVDPMAPAVDPMATPAPVEPTMPTTPEPVAPVTGEQPVVGGMPSGDQGGQMPPTVPPVV